MITNLREQIEALPYYIETDDTDDWLLSRQEVLGVINRHRCIPDRDALARALPDVMSQEVCDAVMGRGHDPLDLVEEWYMTPRELADAIIAALEKQYDAKD